MYAVRFSIFVISATLFFALLLHSVFYATFSIVELNRDFHVDTLIPSLKSQKERSNVVLLDAIGADIVNAVVNSGSTPGSHHCFSSEPPNGVVSGTGWLEAMNTIPIAKEMTRRIAQTQDLPIEKQVALGVQYFDVRVSFVNGDLLVDHGVVYGHAADLFPRLTSAMSSSGRSGFTVDIRNSHYNPSDSNDTVMKARELFMWAMNGSGLSPSQVNVVHSEHADVTYRATTDGKSIAELVKENKDGQPVASFVTFETGDIVRGGLVVLVSAMVCAALLEVALFYVQKRVQGGKIEEEADDLKDALLRDVETAEGDAKRRVEEMERNTREEEPDGRGSVHANTGSGHAEI